MESYRLCHNKLSVYELAFQGIKLYVRVERIINMSRQIRTSAKAVIIQNGKLLAIKVNDGKEECLE